MHGNNNGNLKILWLGNQFFHKELPSDLVDCHYVYPENLCVVHWDELTAQAGFTPDVLVLADCSCDPFLLNVESLPCFTVFYAVDTHIHSWYHIWGQTFDLCLLSLRDHIPNFLGKRLKEEDVLWFPPYAPMYAQPLPPEGGLPESQWDECVFVGTISQERTPKRYVFMQELQKRFSGLRVHSSGSFPKLYSTAKMALNFCEHGDLNFRVAETLACEKCLITPMVGHGLTELFTPGEDLFIYDLDNMDELIQILYLLSDNPNLRAAVASNGRQKVDAQHRATHRATRLARHLCELFRSGAAQESIKHRLNMRQSIHENYLKLLFLHLADNANGPARRKAYFDYSRCYNSF